jgi:hypothetical protein
VRVAIHPSAPFRMTHEVNGVRIRMNARHSGYAVYCEDGSRIDIARLYRKLRSLDLRPKLYPEPLAKKQGADTWLYKSPYVTSRFGSGVISLAHGKEKLVLDFTK